MCSAKRESVYYTCFVVILGRFFTQKYKINGKSSNKISAVLQGWKGWLKDVEDRKRHKIGSRQNDFIPEGCFLWLSIQIVWSSMCGVQFSTSVVEEMRCVHMTLQKTPCSRLLPLSSSVPAYGPISSPLLRPLLSLTSLCPYNSLLSCRGNKIDAGSR